MIKTKKGFVKLKGKTPEILADISSIVEATHKALSARGYEAEAARELVAKSVDMAFAAVDGKFEEFFVEAACKKLDEIIKHFEDKEDGNDNTGNKAGKLH